MITSKKQKASAYLEKKYGPLYFGDLLKAHRLGEELTQEELASKLKITKQKVSDYENRRRLPSIETVNAWAKKLKEPQDIWIKAYVQQQLDESNLNYIVELKLA